jgi:hypothetical protein
MSTGPFAFLADVPHEIYQQTAGTLQAISDNLNPIGRANAGVVGGILNTGRGLAALASLPMAPFVGAYKSIVGHPLASAEHAIGTVINPTVAAQDDPQRMYEQAKADAAASLAAMGARPGTGLVPPWVRTPNLIEPLNGGSSADAAFGSAPEVLPPPDVAARPGGRGEWDLPPTARGRALEQLFGHNLNPNNPTVDIWKEDSGTVTSLKSVDLDSPSYRVEENTPRALYNKLSKCVNDLAEFQGSYYADIRIPEEEIKSRVLTVIVPSEGTAEQQEVMRRIVQLGTQRGLTVNFKSHP